ncbi:hypothetical protein CRYUN_Cryun39dG0084600 [Craigia yunnanensis]
MMDPVNKPKMPPNAEIQNTWTTAMLANMKTNDARTVNSVHNNLVYVQGSVNNCRSNSLESSTAPLRPHTGGDEWWDAINAVSAKGPIGLSNFQLLKRLGYGDIGTVYLVELRGTNAHFAMKVMDKASLASRNKLLRAQTKREILGLLDHPFLPTLYSYFEIDKLYCLVMEFCSGGNLHSLCQKQPNKHFTEEAARPALVKSSSTHQTSNGGGTGGILDTKFAAVHGLRSAMPPHIPKSLDFSHFASNEDKKNNPAPHLRVGGDQNSVTTSADYIEFKYF